MTLCSLNLQENSSRLSEHLELINQEKYDTRERRNICIVLGCLAEKLAGQNSTSLLNEDVLWFLINNLVCFVCYNAWARLIFRSAANKIIIGTFCC